MTSTFPRMLIICCAVLALLGPATSLSQVNDTQIYIVTIDDNNTFIYNDKGICIINGRMSQEHLYEIQITYDNSTIVSNVAPSQYDKRMYIYGYRHDTGNAMIFNNYDKHIIENMMSLIATKRFGSKPIEKLVTRTLNLIYNWPINAEVFLSMDKLFIVTMMGEHPGAVRLWSEIMPQGQELHPAASNNGIISLCGEINETKSASYLTGLVCLDVESKPYLVGPYPFSSGGCFGRCGAGCIGDGPPNNGLNIFTQDCFNHDACVKEQGPFHPCCDEMFTLTADDFIYGKSCTPILKVTIEPNEARASGAWQIENDPFVIDSGWHTSGSTVDWLPSGVYVLNFSHIDGWETPSPQEITIIQERTASTVGMYVRSLPPGSATLISPSGTITTTTPTYTWYAVSNATRYHLYVNDSAGNIIDQWYSAAQANCASGTGVCSVTPSTALAQGSGAWNVMVQNALGDGPWSNGLAFNVATEQLQVFARGGDNSAYQIIWTGSQWSDWNSLGGYIIDAPIAVTYNGQLHVFVVSGDHAIYQMFWDGEQWNGWYLVGGYLASAPAAVIYNGQLHLFAVGEDHALYQMFWDGEQWNGWYLLGGYIIGSPSVASHNGQMDVFVTGGDYAVWWDMFDGNKWSGWNYLGGSTASAPGVVDYTPGG